MNLIPVFNAIGFTPDAAKIYTTLLNHGPLKVAVLAKYSTIPRTTCYEYLPKLMQKGLIEVEVNQKSKHYKITHPQNLLNLVFKQKNDVNFQLSNLENSFDDLNSAYEQTNQASQKPVYENKQLNLDTINSVLKSLQKLKNLQIMILVSKSFVFNQNIKKQIKLLVSKHAAIIPISLKQDFKSDIARYIDYKGESNVLKFVAEDGVIWFDLDRNSVTLLRDESIVKAEQLEAKINLK